MASISRDGNGRKRILFCLPGGVRKAVRLGKVPRRLAEEVRVKIEALVAAKVSGLPLDGQTAEWLARISDGLAAKLAAVGLIPERASAKLASYLDAYITKRHDVKPNTRRNLLACRARLVEYFGPDRPLRDISPGDADGWLLWLRERYAAGTAGRTVNRAKQFFRAAFRSRLIPASPFADVKAPSQVNEARKFFVSRDAAARVLQACPDAEWRLIFALCRFGGLRCPSEVLALKWADVDWERGRLLVRSPKLEHLDGAGERWLPIFPELRPALEEAFDRAEPGAVYAVERYRAADVNLRTQLQRIIRRAGLAAWPKLFHNLRATRQTELAAEYPLHVVCAWIGNSAAIAQKHYLQVTDADYRRATEGGAESGALVAKTAAQNAAQTALRSGCQPSPETKKAPEIRGSVQPPTSLAYSGPNQPMPLVGLEPTTH